MKKKARGRPPGSKNKKTMEKESESQNTFPPPPALTSVSQPSSSQPSLAFDSPPQLALTCDSIRPLSDDNINEVESEESKGRIYCCTILVTYQLGPFETCICNLGRLSSEGTKVLINEAVTLLKRKRLNKKLRVSTTAKHPSLVPTHV